MEAETQNGGWLKVEDVARMLDLSPKTIYLMSGAAFPADRRIPSHRLGPKGGKLRFRAEDIRGYIEAMQPIVKPSAAPFRHLDPKVGGSRRRQP